jgi:putative tryptophan/tyrosine transport system substrate-binding protein
VRRREFITLLGGAAVGWPLAASTQTQPKIPRVGIVFFSTLMADKHLVEAFRQGLRDLGYVEGQTILLEIRSAEGRSERMAELVGLKVDVVVAPTGPAALAAKNATQTIPIVMMAIDPVGLGLVGSLSRPGGNVTGLSYFTEAIAAKKLELLNEIVPGLARVGVLRNPLNPGDPTAGFVGHPSELDPYPWRNRATRRWHRGARRQDHRGHRNGPEHTSEIRT